MSEERPSKSQRKRDMHALQDLGAELVELSDEKLDAVDLPELLRDAVAEARRITDFEGRRRQIQYIGKLMRKVDPEPIRAKLTSWQSVSHADTKRFHLIEEWRERLVNDADAANEFVAAYPHADAARVRELVKDVARERAAGRPPKIFRALFRFVSDVVAGSTARDEIIPPR
jgi:ribosome-associated protein